MAKKLFVVVAVLALSLALHAQSTSDPSRLVGTWKLNPEKSKYSPGPGPRSQTLTWKPSATGLDFTIDTVDAQGQKTQTQVSEKFDGKPYPFKTANYSGTRTSRFIDASTMEEIDTVDGKVRTTRRIAISKDGKVLTVTSKGVNAQGQPTNNVTVYERE